MLAERDAAPLLAVLADADARAVRARRFPSVRVVLDRRAGRRASRAGMIGMRLVTSWVPGATGSGFARPSALRRRHDARRPSRFAVRIGDHAPRSRGCTTWQCLDGVAARGRGVRHRQLSTARWPAARMEWSAARRRLQEIVTDPAESFMAHEAMRCTSSTPRPCCRGASPDSRRLLPSGAPRHGTSADLPPRRRRADAELEAPPHRPPRPWAPSSSRHRVVARPERAQATARDCPCSSVAPPRRRGRGRLRRRYAVDARHLGARVGVRRPRVRRRPAQRLVGARHPGAWEYVPLGPFLAKSFATSVSAWVTPLEALASARRAARAGADAVPYPRRPRPVVARPPALARARYGGASAVVSRAAVRDDLLDAGPVLAHLTVNGASLRTGDLYASGTVSGPEVDQRGSFPRACRGAAASRRS